MMGKATQPAPARRRRALVRGRLAEQFATLALRLKGYRILARNFRCKAGEIDIIAAQGDLVAIIEVKRRPTVDAAIDAVGFDSRRRIANAADFWLSRRADAARLSLRFDVMAVRPWSWPAHIEDVF